MKGDGEVGLFGGGGVLGGKEDQGEFKVGIPSKDTFECILEGK